MAWLGGPTCQTTPQSAIDNWGKVAVLGRSASYQMLNPAGVAMIPPPLAVRPELTAEDVAWLNEQLALTERPPVRYARELPRPPVAIVVQC